MNAFARCSLGFALLLGSTARAEEPGTLSREAVQAAEHAELQAVLDDLVPLVEEAAGRRFTTIPPLVLADPQTLSEVLYAEQKHLLGEVGGMSEEDAAEAARSASSDLSTAFVGKYGFLDKKLYVMREGIAVALAGRGVPLDQVDEVTELVLAHELVHALQDQHTDLATMVGARPDSDGVIAATCTVEGHAVWVQEQVGRSRGHDRAVREVAAILGYDPEGEARTSDPSGFYTAYVYGQGRNFIAHHAARDGVDGVWAVLRQPPATTAMIMHPQTYAPERSPAFDPAVERAVDRVRRRIAPRSWRADLQPVGDYDLRERLVPLGPVAADLPDAWTAGWVAQASASPIEWVEVELLAFDHQGAAEAYVHQMADQARTELAQAMPPLASAITGGPRVDGSVTPFGPMADEPVAAQHRFTFDFGGDTPPQEYRQVWVARGTHVIQAAIVNHEVPDRRVARALRGVLRKVERNAP